MTFVVVTLIDDRQRRRDLELPLDVPMRELGPALAQALGVAEPDQASVQPQKSVMERPWSLKAIRAAIWRGLDCA